MRAEWWKALCTLQGYIVQGLLPQHSTYKDSIKQGFANLCGGLSVTFLDLLLVSGQNLQTSCLDTVGRGS